MVKYARLADDPAEFACKIVELFDDRALARQLAQAGPRTGGIHA